MSDRDETEDILKNPDTRTRRAWVERALQGVRRRLDSGQALPDADETPEAPGRPRLSVVPSSRKR